MIKTYVVDTNVLIQAPYAVQCFEDNHVVLPVVVLEELDNLKKAEGEKGANAERRSACWRICAGKGICWRACRLKEAVSFGWRKISWMWRFRRIFRMIRWITGF